MDLLDSAEEPHPISLSENQGGSCPPSPPGSYGPASPVVYTESSGGSSGGDGAPPWP